ncbi:MAG: Hint domain-containing protein, partial [Alphaproteobacteria bacterium]|nr:Hint domain-containing protein [Alphaproteobacteria bacterium]
VAHIKDDGQQNFNAAQKPLTICFARGVRIRGVDGDVPVEDLVVGDLVATLHHGVQTLRWIGVKRLSNVDLGLHPHLRPILINAGALGQGLPSRDLLVSPQHRMMVESAASQVLFGQDCVLMAAKHLVNDQSVLVARDQAEVTYYHLLFDHHEVIFANGAPSESLHPGDEALSALDLTARGEVLELFPELKNLTTTSRRTALPVLRAFEARVLCDFGAEV